MRTGPTSRTHLLLVLQEPEFKTPQSFIEGADLQDTKEDKNILREMYFNSSDFNKS